MCIRDSFRHAIEQVLSGEHAELILKLNGSDIQLITNPVVRGQKTEGAVILLVNVTETVSYTHLMAIISSGSSCDSSWDEVYPQLTPIRTLLGSV